jgi:hypothetical protein
MKRSTSTVNRYNIVSAFETLQHFRSLSLVRLTPRLKKQKTESSEDVLCLQFCVPFASVFLALSCDFLKLKLLYSSETPLCTIPRESLSIALPWLHRGHLTLSDCTDADHETLLCPNRIERENPGQGTIWITKLQRLPR